MFANAVMVTLFLENSPIYFVKSMRSQAFWLLKKCARLNAYNMGVVTPMMYNFVYFLRYFINKNMPPGQSMQQYLLDNWVRLAVLADQ